MLKIGYLWIVVQCKIVSVRINILLLYEFESYILFFVHTAMLPDLVETDIAQYSQTGIMLDAFYRNLVSIYVAKSQT